MENTLHSLVLQWSDVFEPRGRHIPIEGRFPPPDGLFVLWASRSVAKSKTNYYYSLLFTNNAKVATRVGNTNSHTGYFSSVLFVPDSSILICVRVVPL
jgi:hypothetical protein